MAVVYKKIIAIKTIVFDSGGMHPIRGSLAYGQTYELESILAIGFITDGFAIDYDTALSNPKCPTIIRTDVMRIG
ncbi:hypothetical protein V7419_19740 [Bacillus sp. JJ689]|uniref:hypothetical protein n=1 Tax=Bacillus sp. JJ689 TaxID=3122949 RepID=UPI002FFDB61A